MRIADKIIKYLEKIGVEYVFGMSAGTVSALYDALNDTDIEPIIVKNEAGAAYSAARYAGISQNLGVSIVAGGVGINNMINGIADSMRSKVPVLVISGYVHRWQIGKGAIQEINTEKVLEPITKYSKTILEEQEVLRELKKAIDISLTPPYGPVHLSIPIDIQISEALVEEIEYNKSNDNSISFDTGEIINEAIEIIENEEKGIIMVGKGCRGINDQVKELSKHLNWPIITTPEGKGVISTDFELNLGNYGFSSTDSALNYVEKQEATCILVLGSSLGESATRNYNEVLVAGRKLIHIDWDKRELNKVFKADAAVHCDLKIAIPRLIKETKEKSVKFKREKIVNEPYIRNHTGLSIRQFIEKITDVLPSNTCFVSDIGEYMNFLFKYLSIKEGMDFEISLNYGAMGSGIAGAMGAYLANPDKQIAVIVGDGSFFMNGTEILTAKEYNMPIIYFVINNSMLGYVYNGHNYLYKRTIDRFVHNRISIADMAESLRIKAVQINSIEEIDEIKNDISNLDGPLVVELITYGTEAPPVADRFIALTTTKAV